MADMPDAMDWGEAGRLLQVLLRDPTAATTAAVSDLTMPVSLEAILLADTFDLHMQVNSKKPKPYKRPWEQKPTTTPARTVGKGTRLTPEQFHQRWRDLTRNALSKKEEVERG